jgi:hypothetical protein
MFSMLNNLVSENGLNDKVSNYSLFCIVTPCDHESFPAATPMALKT